MEIKTKININDPFATESFIKALQDLNTKIKFEESLMGKLSVPPPMPTMPNFIWASDKWDGMYLKQKGNDIWNLAWIQDDGANYQAHIQLPNAQPILFDKFAHGTPIEAIQLELENYLEDDWGVIMPKGRAVKREVEEVLRDWSSMEEWNDSIRGLVVRDDDLHITIGEQKYVLPLDQLEDARFEGTLDDYLRDQIFTQTGTATQGRKTMSESKSTRTMVTEHVIDAGKMVGAAQVQNLLVHALKEMTSPLMTEDQKKLVFETEAGKAVIDLVLPLVVHALGQYETSNGRLVPQGEYLEKAGDLAFKAQSARYGFKYGDKLAAALPGIKDQLVALVAGLKQAATEWPSIAEDLGMDDLGLRDSEPAEVVEAMPKKVRADKIIAKTM